MPQQQVTIGILNPQDQVQRLAKVGEAGVAAFVADRLWQHFDDDRFLIVALAGLIDPKHVLDFIENQQRYTARTARQGRA